MHRGTSWNRVEVVDHQGTRFVAVPSVPGVFQFFLHIVQRSLIFLGIYEIFGFRRDRCRRRFQRQIQGTRGRRSGQVPVLKNVMIGNPGVGRRVLHRNVPTGSRAVRMLVDLVTVVTQIIQARGQERPWQRTVQHTDVRLCQMSLSLRFSLDEPYIRYFNRFHFTLINNS